MNTLAPQESIGNTQDKDSRVPAPRELLKLAPAFSRTRRTISRLIDILGEFSPPAPRYVYWHLGRFARTIDALSGIVRPEHDWLDLSSNPWFTLLAHKE